MPILLRQLAKEYGALLPAVTAVAGAFLASTLRVPYLRDLAAPAYVIAAMSIGALSFGHEYTSRTLPLLLVQPCRRERLLLLKLTAAASLVLPVAWSLHMSQPTLSPVVRTYVDAAVLLAITLAPWVTMATRNAIAGAVFTMAIPGLLLVGGDMVASARFGPAAAHALQHDPFRLAFLRLGSMGIAAVALVLTWRTFMRLEALDGPGPSYAPSWLAGLRVDAETSTLQPRACLLLKKELHLQQLTIAIAGSYIVARIMVALLVTPDEDVNSIIVVMTVFYAAVVAALAGATASAEERHLGTHEWQLLLPMPAWQQWAMKAAVALGLAIVLGVVVPWITWLTLPGPIRPVFIGWFEGALLVVEITVTVGSLYLSTISSSGLWALLASVPAAVGTLAFLRLVADPVGDAAFKIAGGVGLPARAYIMWTRSAHAGLIIGLLLATVLVLPFWFGLVNHRTADRAPSRVVLQIGATAAAIIALFAVLGVASARF